MRGKFFRLHVIGVGGIGSHFVTAIPHIVKASGSIDKITLWDSDKVQPKNLLWDQNFNIYHLFENKAAALSAEFNATCNGKNFEMGNIEDNAIYALCVDDSGFRRQFYEAIKTCPHKYIYWVDARAEGNSAMVLSKHKYWDDNYDLLISKTLPEVDVKTGCIINGKLSFGHRIAAAIQAQMILNFINEIENQPILSVVV